MCAYLRLPCSCCSWVVCRHHGSTVKYTFALNSIFKNAQELNQYIKVCHLLGVRIVWSNDNMDGGEGTVWSRQSKLVDGVSQHFNGLFQGVFQSHSWSNDWQGNWRPALLHTEVQTPLQPSAKSLWITWSDIFMAIMAQIVGLLLQ